MLLARQPSDETSAGFPLLTAAEQPTLFNDILHQLRQPACGVVNWDEDLSTGANLIPSHFRSYFIAPAARLNLFAGSAVSPWVSFGGGFGHFSESSTLLYGGVNPGKTGTTTGVVQGGVGLDVKIKGRYSMRGEARDFWSGVPQLNVNTGMSRQHNIFVAGGIVVRF